MPFHFFRCHFYDTFIIDFQICGCKRQIVIGQKLQCLLFRNPFTIHTHVIHEKLCGLIVREIRILSFCRLCEGIHMFIGRYHYTIILNRLLDRDSTS